MPDALVLALAWAAGVLLGAMFFGGASYNNGVLPFKTYAIGEAYTRDGQPAKVLSPGAPPVGTTPSNRVSSVSGLTGIQPFSAIPDSSTTAGARWTGTARNRSKGISPPSRSVATFRDGSSWQTSLRGCQAISRSANAPSSSVDASGDGGIGRPKSMTREISERSRSPRRTR